MTAVSVKGSYRHFNPINWFIRGYKNISIAWNGKHHDISLGLPERLGRTVLGSFEFFLPLINGVFYAADKLFFHRFFTSKPKPLAPVDAEKPHIVFHQTIPPDLDPNKPSLKENLEPSVGSLSKRSPDLNIFPVEDSLVQSDKKEQKKRSWIPTALLAAGLVIVFLKICNHLATKTEIKPEMSGLNSFKGFTNTTFSGSTTQEKGKFLEVVGNVTKEMATVTEPIAEYVKPILGRFSQHIISPHNGTAFQTLPSSGNSNVELHPTAPSLYSPMFNAVGLFQSEPNAELSHDTSAFQTVEKTEFVRNISLAIQPEKAHPLPDIDISETSELSSLALQVFIASISFVVGGLSYICSQSRK